MGKLGEIFDKVNRGTPERPGGTAPLVVIAGNRTPSPIGHFNAHGFAYRSIQYVAQILIGDLELFLMSRRRRVPSHDEVRLMILSKSVKKGVKVGYRIGRMSE